MLQEMPVMSGGGGAKSASGSFTTTSSTTVIDCPCGFVPSKIYVYKIAFNGSATGNYVAIYDKDVNENKQYNCVSTNNVQTDFPATAEFRIKGTTSNGFEFNFSLGSGSPIYYGTYYWVAVE